MSKSINAHAANTRPTRKPIALPGLDLTDDAQAQVAQEIAAWDDALNILAVLAVPESEA